MSKSKLPRFSGKAFLAPMAGISDPALRLVCKELGAGLVVTEFTNIHAIIAKSQLKDISRFIEYSDKERPLSVQLFGSDPEKLEQAVKIVSPHFDIIDFNMGCPAPHITSQMACSALLQEPEFTRKIFKTMVGATDRPVTVKIRAGVDKPDKFKEIAKIAEEEGLAMITLHPRTVKQGYSGRADWSLIKELKGLVKMPVVGNGDINSPEDVKRMMEETGCDYVMIGRAACKNPFIFTQINQFLKTGKYDDVSLKDRLKYFFRYLEYTKMYNIKFANVKMQAVQFTKGADGSKELRLKIVKAKDIRELKEMLEEFSNKL